MTLGKQSTNDGSLKRTRELVAEINRFSGLVETQSKHKQGMIQEARTMRRMREQLRG